MANQQAAHTPVIAAWITTKRMLVCNVCHGVKRAGSAMIQATHHPAANMPWHEYHVCTNCAADVAPNLGSAYPGATPPA